MATSLSGVLRSVAHEVGKDIADSSHLGCWFLHILVGDGANVNGAAAKVFFAWVRAEPLSRGLEFLLMAVKCANHQCNCNLVVGSVVSGKASSVGALLWSASVIGGGCPFQRCAPGVGRASVGGQVCGAIVRLFKYLMSDYFSEFETNLAELVGCLRASAQEKATPHALARQEAVRLQELYGELVFPQELLDILNCGPRSWAHVSAAMAPAGTLGQARSGLLRLLRKRVLVADEKPTLSSMLTSRTHVDCLLLVGFLGCFASLQPPACRQGAGLHAVGQRPTFSATRQVVSADGGA